MSSKKVVVLVSGGMDSVVALHDAIAAGHDVVAAVSFDYGSKHNHREIPFAKIHADLVGAGHRVIDLIFMDELFESDLLKSGGDIPEGHYEQENMKQTVVPFRNGIMLSIAAGFAESIEAEGLVIAAHSGDHAIYPDCREDFMKPMGDAIQAGTYVNLETDAAVHCPAKRRYRRSRSGAGRRFFTNVVLLQRPRFALRKMRNMRRAQRGVCDRWNFGSY